MSAHPDWTFAFAESVGSIDAPDWDRCAGSKNPCVSHAFLAALEDSGCVGEASGWLPSPALLRSQKGELLAAAPSYIKLHSQGEYIFDYHWADAYHRFHPKDSYYPKLQVAVPFSPVPGPRLLVSPGTHLKEARLALLTGLQEHVLSRELSSVHMTFCREEEALIAHSESDYLLRTGEQYHWFNDGYNSFEDFLSALTSRKRKNIRKERAKAHSHGLTLRTIRGDELSDFQCLSFYRLYENTCLRKWGSPYLNLDFFRLLAKRLGPKLVVMLAQDGEGRYVAGAWNLQGEDTLFGRNWGSFQHYDMLHFEVCYYRAIEYAIDQGLAKVEAGAQGTHKIQRGYRPRAVYSAHYLRSPEFARAVEEYLHSERQETDYRLRALTRLEPFKG